MKKRRLKKQAKKTIDIFKSISIIMYIYIVINNIIDMNINYIDYKIIGVYTFICIIIIPTLILKLIELKKEGVNKNV